MTPDERRTIDASIAAAFTSLGFFGALTIAATILRACGAT